MVAVSIIEFIVYGFVAYSAVLMLIISTIIPTPITKSLSLARAIYMLLGVIFAFVLAGIGPTVALPALTTETQTISLNTTEVWNETKVESGNITLLNGSTWTLAHGMMGLLELLFVIQQVLTLLTKSGKQD